MEQLFDKVVHLEKAGTLKQFISAKEKMTLSSLKITGFINSKDFDDVLDEMCSAYGMYDDDDNFEVDYEESPKLRVLDMGECHFVGSTILPCFGYHALLRELVLPQGIEYLCPEIEDPGFSESETLEKIVFPDGLLKIKGLNSCPKLKQVQIPISVKTIESFAFAGASISEIFIPRNVEYVTGGSFGDCPIEKIVVDEQNPYLKVVDGVIYSSDMKKLMACPSRYHHKDFIVPEGVEEIGLGAFEDVQIDHIKLPNSLKTIDTFAFEGCAIQEIDIPDSVTRVGDLSFRFCPNLQSVKLPASLNEIEDQLFSSCPKLKVIDIPASVKVVKYSTLVWSGNVEQLIFHNGLQKIEEEGYPLLRQGKIKELHFPKTLQSLPGGAFRHCTSINQFEIDKDNPYLCTYEGAIYSHDMKKLIAVPNWHRKSFVVPNGVEEIVEYVFAEFTKLTDIELPSTLKKIGQRVFYSCKSLKEITLPNNLIEIHYRAFDDCTSLKTIKVKAQNPPIIWGVCSHWSFTPKPENVTIIVPQGCAEKYRAAKLWKKFKHIVEE